MIEGGFGYIDAEYDELGSGVQSGVTLDSRFARIPEVTANIGASFIHELNSGSDLTYRFDLSYRGDSEGTVQNDPQAFQDSYTVTNVGLVYQTPDENWRLSAGATNLTDEEYTLSVNVNPRLGYSEAVYARGREFYLSAEYLFGK